MSDVEKAAFKALAEALIATCREMRDRPRLAAGEVASWDHRADRIETLAGLAGLL